jgi:hypothetical protein
MYQTLAIDALDVLQDFVGTNHIGRSQFDLKRAIISAVDVVSQENRWHYERSHFTFETDAPYSTGTVTWSASTRQWALSSGTFPSWAHFGTMHVESVGVGEVLHRINDTSIEMPADTSFGDQTHSAVSYTLFRDRYRLPFAVRQVGEPIEFTSGWNPRHVDLGQLLHHRAVAPQTGTPTMYSLARDASSPGSTVLYLYPAPDTASLWSMTVNRAPRQIHIWGTETDASAGTIVADITLRNLAGTGMSWTNFDYKHIGACVRWGISTSQLPTGPEGDYPYREQQVIIGLSGVSNLWIPTEPIADESGVKYRISDPIDLEPSTLQAFWTRCRYELCMQRPKEHGELINILRSDYLEKIALARKSSNYQREPMLHGGGRPVLRTLSSFPSGADDE